LHRRDNTEGQIDIVGGDSVSHELKLAIGGNKRNGSVRIEFPEPYTTMERTIINLDTRFALSLLFNDKLIIQTKLALGHTRQFGIHLNYSRHFISQDGTGTG
jgi:hypothetical protein